MNFKVYEVSYIFDSLSKARETPLNLSSSRTEVEQTYVKITPLWNTLVVLPDQNPNNESEHMEPSPYPYLFVKIKYGGLANIYIS